MRADDAFLKTTMVDKGSSAAEMDAQPGYCMLNLWPRGIVGSFGSEPASGVDDAVVQRLVVMHEVGHCVDMSRDVGSFTDPRASSHSVAPQDAASVHDVASLYEVGLRNSTSQWREVYADLFAMGYARLTYPTVAPAIAQWLMAQRIDAAATDPVHATACWIGAATKADSPTSLADLREWADRQRASAKCRVTGGSAK